MGTMKRRSFMRNKSGSKHDEGEMAIELKTKPGFVIRCATPDCDWGFQMWDLGGPALESCYAAFRKHCVEMHGLSPHEVANVFFDIERWTLRLDKQSRK
jgi:hypothetical protein